VKRGIKSPGNSGSFLPMHWLVQKIEQGRMKKWLEKMK
jgi:hypothetical protein